MNKRVFIWPPACALALCLGAVAWAGQSTDAADAQKSPARKTDHNKAQIIEVTPVQQTRIYAVHGPDGRVVLTHEPPEKRPHDEH